MCETMCLVLRWHYIPLINIVGLVPSSRASFSIQRKHHSTDIGEMMLRYLNNLIVYALPFL